MNDQGLERILNVIASDDSGLTVKQIRENLSPPILPRTLQRKLKLLENQNLIFRIGQGRATRYYAKQTKNKIIDLTEEGYIKLSKEGDEIRKQISKPINERKNVTYNGDFLFNYIPNQTFYLKPEIRHHLDKIGRVMDDEQPAGTFIKKILGNLLIDLSWNSSRLEGNTYSLLDTERLIRQGTVAEGKDLFETRMILNHKSAIEFLVELDNDLEFNRYTIFNLHALLSKNLLSDPGASGRLRQMPVGIGKTVYQPLSIPQLINEYFEKLIDTAKRIVDPFEQSFFSMVHLPYLQPFIDVNKRVSRLAANIPLIKHNLCPISFVDVPRKAYIDGTIGVYELNKIDLLLDVYVWAYERSTLRYNELQFYLNEPNKFIEQYDIPIRDLINQIILDCQTKNDALNTIHVWAKANVVEKDRDRFIEAVETQLLAVHEGNIANYKVKPKEFMAWRKVWE